MLRRRLTSTPLNSWIKQGLQLDLTSTLLAPARRLSREVIRVAIITASLSATSCTTYLPAISDSAQKLEPDSGRIPKVDLSQARWQKLVPTQPEQNPVRIAILEKDEKIGATRIALKSPPNMTIPPHWFAVQGSCTILQGTFVIDGVDSKGRPERVRKRPGDFVMLPPNYILRLSTEGSADAILYLTLYGEWSPQFQANPWGKPSLRGAN